MEDSAETHPAQAVCDTSIAPTNYGRVFIRPHAGCTTWHPVHDEVQDLRLQKFREAFVSSVKKKPRGCARNVATIMLTNYFSR